MAPPDLRDPRALSGRRAPMARSDLRDPRVLPDRKAPMARPETSWANWWERNLCLRLLTGGLCLLTMSHLQVQVPRDGEDLVRRWSVSCSGT